MIASIGHTRQRDAIASPTSFQSPSVGPVRSLRPPDDLGRRSARACLVGRQSRMSRRAARRCLGAVRALLHATSARADLKIRPNSGAERASDQATFPSNSKLRSRVRLWRRARTLRAIVCATERRNSIRKRKLAHEQQLSPNRKSPSCRRGGSGGGGGDGGCNGCLRAQSQSAFPAGTLVVIVAATAATATAPRRVARDMEFNLLRSQVARGQTNATRPIVCELHIWNNRLHKRRADRADRA